MAVHSKKLASVAVPGGDVDTLLFTAPPAETTILKDWHVGNPDARPLSRVLLYLRSGPATVTLMDTSLPGFGTRSDQIWCVLNPGDTIRCIAVGEPPAHVWLSGTELDGLAD